MADSTMKGGNGEAEKAQLMSLHWKPPLTGETLMSRHKYSVTIHTIRRLVQIFTPPLGSGFLNITTVVGDVGDAASLGIAICPSRYIPW